MRSKGLQKQFVRAMGWYLRGSVVTLPGLRIGITMVSLQLERKQCSFQKAFSERAKAVPNDAYLSYINIQENNILAFLPWDIHDFYLC
ncbi:hypothetical protein TNCV_657451 [Trichonephila clavipes]|nr:hypothetical protein TNCV_657451 [Trichonephila clavipes]